MKSNLPAIVACFALVIGCRHGGKGPAQPPEDELWIGPEAFARGGTRVVEARRQLLPQAIAGGARITFDDLRVSHVLAPVTGRITRVLAQLGQEVQKGTPLAAIASPDVGTAVADEVKARGGLTAAQHEFERQKRIFEAKAGSRRELETAEDNYNKARAEEQRALQRLRLLRVGNIDRVTQEYLLLSPIDGRVVARTVSPGMEVQGQFSGGAPSGELFTVGSIDTVWLYADVGEADLADLRVGAEVSARVLAYPSRSFRGKAEWISSTLDPALRTARIRCSLPNPERLLKPEMYATVYVERPSVQRLTVPRDAVVRISDQSFVYVDAGERPDGRQVFKRRHVRVPEHEGAPHRKVPPRSEIFVPLDGRDLDAVPVLEGLVEGERVLVETGQQQQQASATEVLLTPSQQASGKVVSVVVTKRDVVDSVTVGGRLTFDDLRVSHVLSPVGGRITKVMAAPGQHVKKGDALAIIQSPEVGSAFSDLLKAKADLVAAEHEVKRQQRMYALHASSQRDLQVAEDNYSRSRAEYERTAQKTRLLRAGAVDSVSQQFVLRSPIDGHVVARMVNPGLEVQGQYSAGGNVIELFTVGSIDDLWLLGDVYEADLPYVRPGVELDLRVSAYPGVTFAGKVDWVSDTIDPVMRTAKVRCILKNEQGLLRPEMYGVVSIAARIPHALTIPRDALLRSGDGTYVFVEQPLTSDGHQPFQRRRVIADEKISGNLVVVLAGLEPGERVAARGSIFLLGN